jgi:hypothetical protein
MNRRSGILNPIQTSNLKRNFSKLTKNSSDLSELYIINSQIFAKNVFFTIYDKDYKKKDLHSATFDIFEELNKNSNRLKNHTKYPIKSFLIKNEDISQNNSSGHIKIWLIYNLFSGIFDYVIQIELPENNKNRNINIKKIILRYLNKVDCNLIIKKLIKLRIKYKLADKSCDLFKWSFHIKDIPVLTLNISNQNISAQNLERKPNSLQNLGRTTNSAQNLERKPNSLQNLGINANSAQKLGIKTKFPQNLERMPIFNN